MTLDRLCFVATQVVSEHNLPTSFVYTVSYYVPASESDSKMLPNTPRMPSTGGVHNKHMGSRARSERARTCPPFELAAIPQASRTNMTV